VSAETPGGWETVIGLEVHCELATATKLFCSCANAFGAEPNTNVCPVCLGLPGSLPVLNRRAVELAMRLGRALHCTVEPSVFARKNYFYPDMPKDYQVSQYDRPINVEGWLELPSGQRVGIERAHIEEDTGKNTHVGGGGRIHGAGYSLIDYNRAGVPLVEIVGRPDLRSADDAKAYVDELRGVLLATGVSDARMEEGSLRIDANVSVRRTGSEVLGTRCEIKNLNSLRSLGRAIDFEARRQVDLIESGERVHQETRHWDEEGGRTRPGRSKEEAEDYRYFQEPDLVPLAPSVEWIAEIDASMPALPFDLRARLAEATGASTAEVAIAVDRGLDELALSAIAAGGDPARVLTHVEHDLATEGAERIDPAHLAELVTMEVAGTVTATQAKQVLADLVAEATAEPPGPRRSPAEIAAGRGFEAMDAGALEAVVDDLVASHPDEWADYRAAEVAGDHKRLKKLSGFFTGRIMQATRGQADGREVARLLERKRSAPGP
jgi:aspartyl-tRNA(Asn)/glutamyl-tRNA(Gln) amidotransferase subunit B